MLRAIALSLAPVWGLGVAVGVHVLVSRFVAVARHHGLIISIAAGAATVLAVRGIGFRDDVAQMSTVDAWASLAGALLAYVLLAWSYVFGFFNIGESARRIRLVIELEAAGDRGLTLDGILAVYDSQRIVDARLDRLLVGRQIVERDGRYVIGSALMLTIAKLLVVGKILFLGRPSEVEAR